MSSEEKTIDTTRIYQTANRMVVSATLEDLKRYEHIDASWLVVPMQSLPIDIGEWLRIDFPVAKSPITTTWLVNRVSATQYVFVSVHNKLGGTFALGNIAQKVGWYAPPKGYRWMGGALAGAITMSLVWFFEEVEKREQYPFLVTSSRDPKTIKNPGKRKKLEEQTNVIVYLGRPPSAAPKKGKNTDKVPREFGYPRKQHRRTLRAERFKNHPKYGVYKGVLVTQSWCGPKTYVHKRKVYRLWEPPEVDTTGG